MIVEHSSRSLNESNLINPKNFRLPTLIPAIISLVSRLLPLTISHHVDKSTWNYQPLQVKSIDNNWYKTRRYHVFTVLVTVWLQWICMCHCLLFALSDISVFALAKNVTGLSGPMNFPYLLVKTVWPLKETSLQLVHWNVLHFCRHSINSTLVAHWTIARQNVHRTVFL